MVLCPLPYALTPTPRAWYCGTCTCEKPGESPIRAAYLATHVGHANKISSTHTWAVRCRSKTMANEQPAQSTADAAYLRERSLTVLPCAPARAGLREPSSTVAPPGRAP